MAQQLINIGTVANDSTGDPLRSACNKANANFTELYGTVLLADTTVNLTNSMTTAELQAAIDAVPKNLNSKTLTFQFANGTYNLTAALAFNYFNGGTLIIQGNSADTSVSQTKSVVLNGASGQNVISVFAPGLGNTVVRWIKAVVNTTASHAALSLSRGYGLSVQACAFTNAGSTTTAGHGAGISALFGNALLVGNSLAYMDFGIYAAYGFLISENNVSANSSRYGLASDSAYVIRRAGTQPTGTVGNTLTQNGGQLV